MHKEFNVDEKEPILVPRDLRRFCRRNGARTIFDNMLGAISDKRHSEQRREFYEKKSCGDDLQIVLRQESKMQCISESPWILLKDEPHILRRYLELIIIQCHSRILKGNFKVNVSTVLLASLD